MFFQRAPRPGFVASALGAKGQQQPLRLWHALAARMPLCSPEEGAGGGTDLTSSCASWRGDGWDDIF
jgi:hypothetical protein